MPTAKWCEFCRGEGVKWGWLKRGQAKFNFCLLEKLGKSRSPNMKLIKYLENI